MATDDLGYEGGTSRGAVEVLADEGVIEDGTASTLRDAVGFRNVLAHEYASVRSEQVYEHLQYDLAVYDEFSQQVAAWFEERYD